MFPSGFSVCKRKKKKAKAKHLSVLAALKAEFGVLSRGNYTHILLSQFFHFLPPQKWKKKRRQREKKLYVGVAKYKKFKVKRIFDTIFIYVSTRGFCEGFM
jgi:hypothetical protein